ncbi:CLUMA_CG007327, isoform A [Clunio marinus]|uniref:CLUMA_CG007327, isoform A n=1 Tax=Clunio marinus TaxID=568069 RepID=A0A1J1I0B7_9DIPT|nr:CLUMA_CG007327, isoform A [Clunio marinus]
MKSLTSFWSTRDKANDQVNQTNPIDNSFNSVTFSNCNSRDQNPIIIATTHHPSQISIIHEVTNSPTNLPAKNMTSPDDSFQSNPTANFNKEKREGKVNLAFTGSHSSVVNIQQQSQQSHSHQQPHYPQNYVFRQSYWSWHWPWQNWNQREKVFLLIIVILSLCILSLTSALSIVIQKNIQYRDILFNQLGLEL